MMVTCTRAVLFVALATAACAPTVAVEPIPPNRYAITVTSNGQQAHVLYREWYEATEGLCEAGFSGEPAFSAAVWATPATVTGVITCEVPETGAP